MLSLARSRLTLFAQFVFLATNAMGVLVGTVYAALTPDLYPNNAHAKIGWIVTAVVTAQVLVGVVGWAAGTSRKTQKKRAAFLPVATHADRYRENHDYQLSPYRHSDDSGHGTEPHTESLRSNSVSTLHDQEDVAKEYDEGEEMQRMPFSPSSASHKSALARVAAKMLVWRVWKYLDRSARVINRIILPFGFIALSTGVVTFGRFFVS